MRADAAWMLVKWKVDLMDSSGFGIDQKHPLCVSTGHAILEQLASRRFRLYPRSQYSCLDLRHERPPFASHDKVWSEVDIFGLSVDKETERSSRLPLEHLVA